MTDTTLPPFEYLSDQYAVVLAGRLVARDRTRKQLEALKEVVDGLAAEHSLPLAVVTPTGWDGDDATVYAPVFVGRVLSYVKQGLAPIQLDAAIFDDAAVPDGVWEAIASRVTETTASSCFLLPTGWSQSILMTGELVPEDEDWEPDWGDWEGEVDGDEIAVVSSEDTEPFAELGPDRIAAIRDGDAYLWSVYI